NEGAARTQTGHEVRQTAVCLLDDLRTCCIEMRAPVAVVAVLVRIEILLRVLSNHSPDFSNRAVGSLEWTGHHELGPKGAKNQFPFRTRVFRQEEFPFVAARGPDHRIGDSGVA